MKRFAPFNLLSLQQLVVAGILLCGPRMHAQDLEPRAYVNLPTGLNFLVAGYAYSEGGLATDPALPIEDAHLEIHTVPMAYVRSIALGGRSGKFDIIAPYAHLSGTALVSGKQQERRVDGFLDPRFRLSVNLIGGQALSLRDYASHRSDLVVGASMTVSPPLGQYDSDRLVNLGANRWTVKPETGFSKKLGRFTVDMTGAVTFFTDNDEYFGGKTFEQDPIYSAQANVSYDIGRGIWAALGTTYYIGGATATNGAQGDSEINNSRVGVTVAFPLNKKYSLKFNASKGVSTRIGTSFNTVGAFIQYRWGAGL